ncbi:hypothetical protein HY605_01955 [Candidatus Peregrinibacteria bacterium]|nr:hypothetical protein [Candidatus Peregrinibacteria bacterium]
MPHGDVINLRKDDADEPEFKIKPVDDEKIEAVKSIELEAVASTANDRVKVKFEKFVNLIATHAYEDIIAKHEDDDVIISTDLLADLANAHEEKPEKKMPLVFVFGIALGLFVAWIFLRT